MKKSCTKVPLLIFRSIIDDSKTTKKAFYSATLDVAEAYDSVPFDSIFQSLTRIKIPNSFTHQVRKLLNRTIRVVTPIGITRTIKVDRGLPQGDPMSPIPWNIFYDALLVV